jgi:ubiquinone/menaquinone biosynthesis C-methylase UbiE
MQTSAPAEIGDLKGRLKGIWMAGDYDRFSRFMERSVRAFHKRLNIEPGNKVLDVGCGSGQLALVAAREGAEVTGVDIASNSIAKARVRAKAEGLRVRFEEGDAEQLPFADCSFDVVASLIGAMFAPRPEKVAGELLRVCAPGGTIGMANWTPSGFIGQMFRAISQFLAPNGMPSPVLWGEESVVRERLGAGLRELKMARRHYVFDYPFGAAEVVDFFAHHYGPLKTAFESLQGKAAESLRQALVQLWSQHNKGDEGLTIVDAEYLEVIGTRA